MALAPHFGRCRVEKFYLQWIPLAARVGDALRPGNDRPICLGGRVAIKADKQPSAFSLFDLADDMLVIWRERVAEDEQSRTWTFAQNFILRV